MNEPVQMHRQGMVLVITIHRPHARNAIDGATALALASALDELDHDPTVAVGVLTGGGGTFSAGMDLKAFLRGEDVEVPGRGLAGLTRRPPRRPLIAAVEGYALAGGFELVLACDLVVAASNATFGLPEVKRGLMAGSGGLLRLQAQLPPAIAMEHALTGDTLTAVEAHRWGLVNRLTAPGEALATALELADQICSNSPFAVQASKAIVAGAADWSQEQAWAEQDALLAQVLASDDAKEGAAAFVEKRPPVWRAR